jgi:hypothetical protein
MFQFQFAWKGLGRAARQHRCLVCDALFLLAVVAGAALIAYGFDVFPNGSSAPGQQKLVHLQEALALASLFCGGLLALAWRVFVAEQRAVARQIGAARAARERAMRDMLTSLPYGQSFSHARG